MYIKVEGTHLVVEVGITCKSPTFKSDIRVIYNAYTLKVNTKITHKDFKGVVVDRSFIRHLVLMLLIKIKRKHLNEEIRKGSFVLR